MHRFYIFTADHSGLPLALWLAEEGEEVTLCMIPPEVKTGKKEKVKPQEKEYLLKNGDGLVRKMWAYEAEKEIVRYKNESLVIFDQIYGWHIAETLRKKGVKVLNGKEVGWFLEVNRREALKIFSSLGVDVPLQKNFGPGSVNKAIKFLEDIGDEMLFVLKSDNPKVTVEVAQDSNEELIDKLNAERDEINKDDILLQQKVSGHEFAIETWYYDGEPVLASVDIELKKKYNEMCDVQTGCSADLVFMVPVESKIRERGMSMLDRFAADHIGTGLLDLSIIYDEKEDKMWALECCGSRFGYNAIYTMLSLLEVPVGSFFRAYMSGDKHVADMFAFRKFGASLRLFNDGKTEGVPIIWRGHRYGLFFPWDCRMEGDNLVTTGGDESFGIVTSVGETPESAMSRLRYAFNAVGMPTKWARDDFDDDDSPRLILPRFHGLVRAGLIDFP